MNWTLEIKQKNHNLLNNLQIVIKIQILSEEVKVIEELYILKLVLMKMHLYHLEQN